MPRDLARIGARTFAVQALDGALDQRRKILAPPRQRQRFGEEGDRIACRHCLGQRVGVLPRRTRLQRRLFGRARQIQQIAAGAFDEQRLLGTEVIGDLARERARGGCDIGDRGARQPPLPKQRARRIQQQRTHLAAGRACGTRDMLRIACHHLKRLLDRLIHHWCSPLSYLYDIQTNKSSCSGCSEGPILGPSGPKPWPCNLAKPAKIRISAPSADPGRELNGRSQQIIRDFGVAGPVGPSSRVSAF